MKKFTFLKTMLLATIFALGSGSMFAAEVVYTISTTTAVNTTGTAPANSSAAYAQTYSTKSQITRNNSATLTLSGFAGHEITKITLSMRSNGSAGAGTLSVTVGTDEIASATGNFSSSDWAGKYSAAYLDVIKTPTSRPVEDGENIVINIAATTNSLYIASYTIEYNVVPTGPTINVSPESLVFSDVAVGTVGEDMIEITGAYLTEDISAEIAGDFFEADENVIDKAGSVIIVTYTPSSPGTHTAVLTLTSGTVTKTVALSGNAILGAPVALAADPVAINTFTANWETVSGAAEYELNVYSRVDFFSEGFDEIAGTGGNDDRWNGSIATSSANALTDWTLENVFGADACLKAGSGSGQGVITTPALGLTGDAAISFRAGAWDGSSESTSLLLEVVGNGTLSVTSVAIEKGVFNSYTVAITGGDADTKVSFKGEKSSNSRFFLDDVVVKSQTSVAGYPQTVTGTSHAVSGLTPNTEYFYTLKATADIYESALSNEIAVTTQGTTGLNTVESGSLYAADGIIHFNALAGEKVEIYNSLGQSVYQGIAVEGTNSLAVKAGVVIVKIGNAVNKVIVK